MTLPLDVVLTGGIIINHDGINFADIGIYKEKISFIGDCSRFSRKKTVNCHNLHILPGVIDTQVHFREPGLTHKEDLESGACGAVMGGVTCVFEMPNTIPPTTTQKALEDKITRAQGRMQCDFAFWIGGTQETLDQTPRLERLPGVAGIKVFMGSSTGSLLMENASALLQLLSKTRRRVAFHAEDEARLRARLSYRKSADPGTHPLWRDARTALQATQKLVSLAEETQRCIHILHLSTQEEVDFLKDYKDRVSIEVTPHHLTLDDAAYATQGTLIQMNPPIRNSLHQRHLWWAVKQGIIDILGSDHAPHTRAEKQKPYPDAPSGMTGVQTLVPIMLDHVNHGRLSLQRLVDMTSTGPARLFGLSGKGRLAVGYDADLTIVDLMRRETITNHWIASKCGWTPYDGKTVLGWPVGTFVRGTQVMWEGELLTRGGGRPARFM